MAKENREFGRYGGKIITDTTTTTGTFHVISFFEDSVINSITIKSAEDVAFTGSLAGKTLPAGYDLYGKITSIKLTSGACIAYTDEDD